MVLILLIDDDAIVRQVFGAKLRARGHRVVDAPGGEQALVFVGQETPDLIVTDVQMPVMDGWSLVRTLRGLPHMALVPVIFLTELDSAEDRIRGFKIGADDFIPKTCASEEFQMRVQRALERGSQVQTNMRKSNRERSGMTGDLAVIGPASLLTLLEMERKTGELFLKRQQEEVKVCLRAGRVVDAACVGDPSIVGAECIYRVLSWSAGEFFLTSTVIDGPDRIGIPTTHLLMEGARRMDEEGQAR